MRTPIVLPTVLLSLLLVSCLGRGRQDATETAPAGLTEQVPDPETEESNEPVFYDYNRLADYDSLLIDQHFVYRSYEWLRVDGHLNKEQCKKFQVDDFVEAPKHGIRSHYVFSGGRLMQSEGAEYYTMLFFADSHGEWSVWLVTYGMADDRLIDSRIIYNYPDPGSDRWYDEDVFYTTFYPAEGRLAARVYIRVLGEVTDPAAYRDMHSAIRPDGRFEDNTGVPYSEATVAPTGCGLDMLSGKFPCGEEWLALRFRKSENKEGIVIDAGIYRTIYGFANVGGIETKVEHIGNGIRIEQFQLAFRGYSDVKAVEICEREAVDIPAYPGLERAVLADMALREESAYAKWDESQTEVTALYSYMVDGREYLLAEVTDIFENGMKETALACIDPAMQITRLANTGVSKYCVFRLGGKVYLFIEWYTEYMYIELFELGEEVTHPEHWLIVCS